MLPAFEKKPAWFLKRDSQNWWDLNKTVPTASEFDSALGDRDRNKNSKPRQHSRSITRHDSLPTIIEPPETARTGTASIALSEECNSSLGSRTEKTEKFRLCIKRWKKISFGRSHASASNAHDHFEPLENFRRLARIVRVVIRIGHALERYLMA